MGIPKLPDMGIPKFPYMGIFEQHVARVLYRLRYYVQSNPLITIEYKTFGE
jgi:hypothetical protein